MQRKHSTTKHGRAIRTVGGLLVGGVATGFLLAMTVPTTMKQHADDSWRELVRKPISDYEPVTFAAAPEDLTPVYWQSASQEYPAPDSFVDPVFDAAQAEPAIEPLPAELLESREGSVTVELVQTDQAAFSAQAAQAAAVDVRMVESAVAPGEEPAPIVPEAAAAAS